MPSHLLQFPPQVSSWVQSKGLHRKQSATIHQGHRGHSRWVRTSTDWGAGACTAWSATTAPRRFHLRGRLRLSPALLVWADPCSKRQVWSVQIGGNLFWDPTLGHITSCFKDLKCDTGLGSLRCMKSAGSTGRSTSLNSDWHSGRFYGSSHCN